MLITSRMIGTGSGITSPNSPPRATNSAMLSTRRMKWKLLSASADSGKPAAL